MNRPHVRMNRCRKGAALVMCLFLVTMLVSTGSTLAMLAATETVRADHEALNLDHELAVSSLIAYLPLIMAGQEKNNAAHGHATGGSRITLAFGECEIHCRVMDESSKLSISTATSADRLGSQLQSLARENGLPADNIHVRPIVESPATKGWPELVWFEQLTAQTEFEEVFHRRRLSAEAEPSERHPWSDLVTFWKSGAGKVVGLDIQTTVGRSVQRHYVVVVLTKGKADVLYRGRP